MMFTTVGFALEKKYRFDMLIESFMVLVSVFSQKYAPSMAIHPQQGCYSSPFDALSVFKRSSILATYSNVSSS